MSQKQDTSDNEITNNIAKDGTLTVPSTPPPRTDQKQELSPGTIIDMTLAKADGRKRSDIDPEPSTSSVTPSTISKTNENKKPKIGK